MGTAKRRDLDRWSIMIIDQPKLEATFVHSQRALAE